MSREVQNVKLSVIDGGKSIPNARYIEEVFGQTGYLSKQFDNYEPRRGQIAIAKAIDAAIREDRHLIAEGPTGTGKSLAYSVPAAFHAVHAGKKVCIVTANKNLQRQVYQKDLALLGKAVPWKFNYAIRKGISSYLCLRDLESEKWRELADGTLTLEEHKMMELTSLWAGETSTGDFEDSPGPSKKIWRGFSTTSEECDRRGCLEYDNCFVNKAKRRADGSGIIVTNYHLLFLHLSMGPGSKILPEFDVVILDEAHRASKIARDFFGIELTFGSLYRCVTNMHLVRLAGFDKKGRALRDQILGETAALFNFLNKKAASRDTIIGDKWTLKSEKLEDLLSDAYGFYKDAAKALGWSPDAKARGVQHAQRLTEGKNYAGLADKCLERKGELAEFRTQAREGTVYFIEGSADKDKWVKLRSKAVEVAARMHHGLFKRFPSVIQTSATLAIKGGTSKSNFEYVRKEMGMRGLDNVSEITVPSPFNWEKQGLLVIPKSMPEYKYGDEKMAWEQAVCSHFEKVINMVGGRTMGLFTSFRMMNMVGDHLKGRIPYKIYRQGEATNREQADKFQNDVSSILLGTESFSEGISIEGEACTCVILDKIPFVSGGDPVMWGIERSFMEQRGMSQKKAGLEAFQEYSVPEAIISFKQRVGRLIRTVNDVGVIVVLDKRLHTRRYRHQFTKSSPFSKVHDSIDVIEPFLRRVKAL